MTFFNYSMQIYPKNLNQAISKILFFKLILFRISPNSFQASLQITVQSVDRVVENSWLTVKAMPKIPLDMTVPNCSIQICPKSPARNAFLQTHSVLLRISRNSFEAFLHISAQFIFLKNIVRIFNLQVVEDGWFLIKVMPKILVVFHASLHLLGMDSSQLLGTVMPKQSNSLFARKVFLQTLSVVLRIVESFKYTFR